MTRDGRQLFAAPGRIDLELNHLNHHIVPHRVVRAHGAIDGAAVVKPTVDVFQEVRRRHRRAGDVDGEIDVAERRLEPDEDFSLLRVRLWRRQDSEEEGG
jgi:hypothetical protein